MPGTLDKFTLLKRLGAGVTAEVHLGQDNSSGERYAIKIFDLSKMNKRMREQIRDEVEVYQKVDHANIIKIFDYKEEAEYVDSKGRKKIVNYIVMELISKGEFFDFLALKPCSAAVCRFFFSHMLHALHTVHCSGHCHRDLKPENMLIGEDYNLKIVDFGFTAPIEGRKETGWLHTDLGTPGYMAPEIREDGEYKGHEIDIFAIAVILFIMYTGHPPFSEAHKTDPHYKYFYHAATENFWRAHKQQHEPGFFSDEFIDLMTNMLQYNASDRLSMSEVIGHPWMQNGRTATLAEVQADFKERDRMLQKSNKESIKENQKPRQQAGNKVHRSLGGVVFYEQEEDVSEELRKDQTCELVKQSMEPFIEGTNSRTIFFSRSSGLAIVAEFDKVMESLGIEYTRDKENWRLNFEMKGKLLDDQSEEDMQEYYVQPKVCEVQVDLSRVNPEQVAVEFTRIKGDSYTFHQRYQELKWLLSEVDNSLPPGTVEDDE